MASEAVDVVILGRSYKVACPTSQQDALHNAAELLEKSLTQLKQRSSTMHVSAEQLAILAALNLCYELQLEKDKNRLYSQTVDRRIKSLQNTIEVALMAERSRSE